MADYEKLGAFYLGRVFDAQAAQTTENLLLYDSKDLTTHALCVGMTGSGKTGLCIALLEEAAIDGIPALVIDPKGDLGNLLLTFPELRPEDFEPWVDPGEASRNGMTSAEFATQVAERWRQGLADWGQDGSRIARLQEAAEVAIYTPGSSSGRPLRVLRSLNAPSAALLADTDALRDRVQATVSGLLALLDIEADPIRSREHILLANLLDRAWREGRDLELAALIAEIQSPPFQRLGVLDLESFFPAQDRFELGLRLNNLLASPGFGAWLEGEPLDVGKLLYTAQGKPRLAILSIAHLAERERMFFVTLLLNEVVSWMRAQPGSASLRAILYMDEVFGYFPPSANPPSKLPMLTLLKQARAYGLGVVLATQNPVDLDYKGLSNCGTWFLGRLQTERDKARVLDGLEGAAASAGSRFDRPSVDRILSGLRSRVFLLNNVHDDRPELFESRWALSYLRGPLTREQIRALSSAPATETPSLEPAKSVPVRERPLLPPEISELFIAADPARCGEGALIYRPALLGRVTLHYVDAKSDCDHWATRHLLAPLAEPLASDPWESAESLGSAPQLAPSVDASTRFAELPPAAARAASYATWNRQLKSAAYRDLALPLLRAPQLEQSSRPGEDEGSFRARLAHGVREARDVELEKLKQRYAPRLAQLEQRIRTAQERVAREADQHSQQKLQTAISFGATVLGALLGRKALGAGSLGRATTAMRGAGRISREAEDVVRAGERVEDLRAREAALDAEFREACAALQTRLEPSRIALETLRVPPRKSDIAVESVSLAWTPWQVARDGSAQRAF